MSNNTRNNQEPDTYQVVMRQLVEKKREAALCQERLDFLRESERSDSERLADIAVEAYRKREPMREEGNHLCQKLNSIKDHEIELDKLEDEIRELKKEIRNKVCELMEKEVDSLANEVDAHG